MTLRRLSPLFLLLVVCACASPLTVAESRDGSAPPPAFGTAVAPDGDASADAESVSDPVDAATD